VRLEAELSPRTSPLLALLGVLWPLRALAALPHYVAVGVLGLVMSVTAWIGFGIVLFTGHYPAGLLAFHTGILRWSARLSGWLFGVTDAYPPFRLG
jgi:hypothetical protein